MTTTTETVTFIVHDDGTFEECDPEMGNTTGTGDWRDIIDLHQRGELLPELQALWTETGFNLELPPAWCGICDAILTIEDTPLGVCDTCLINAPDDLEECRQCGASTADGEGYDGLCGNCADAAEDEGDPPALKRTESGDYILTQSSVWITVNDVSLWIHAGPETDGSGETVRARIEAYAIGHEEDDPLETMHVY